MLETRTLGKTGLQVTRLGLGMAALGRPGYINLGHASDLSGKYQVEAMEANAHEVLDAAYQAGLRYFDAARSYGRGEAFLANWLNLREIAPDEVCVGSKWGYTYTANWEVDAEHHEIKEHSIDVLDRQWRESRDLLGSQLDLYQIHSATLDSGVMQNPAVLSRLSQIKSEGTAIGFSVSGERQADVIEKGLSLLIDGVPLFNSVQATYNALETSTAGILQAAHADGVGVIVKEALANGRLTSRNTAPHFQRQMDLLRQQADRLDTTIDAFALAAVLAQPWADIVLSGAATLVHLASNLQAASVVWDDEAGEITSSLKEEPLHYWKVRSQMDWN
ncbi:MAG: aldo/keto reductase [Anaerolineales bacterium]|nr:aldo/keto reductase [Anaerolineales bacterium]